MTKYLILVMIVKLVIKNRDGNDVGECKGMWEIWGITCLIILTIHSNSDLS